MTTKTAKRPQPRNRHSIRHGLRAAALPKGASYVSRATNELRRFVEAAVVDVKGEVSLIDAATIQTLCRWERHAMLAQLWLRKSFAELNPDQRLKYSAEIARASAERDRALRSLGIDRKSNVWDSLHASPTLATDAANGSKANGSARTAPDATGAIVGDLATVSKNGATESVEIETLPTSGAEGGV